MKILVILGVRRSNLPYNRALTLADVKPLRLLPLPRSMGRDIHTELTKLTEHLGSLRPIVADEGSDLKAGINLYRQAHPKCDYVIDIVHKLAGLLNRELSQDDG